MTSKDFSPSSCTLEVGGACAQKPSLSAFKELKASTRPPIMTLRVDICEKCRSTEATDVCGFNAVTLCSVHWQWIMQFKEHMKRRLIIGQHVLRHCACRVDGNSPHTHTYTISVCVVNLVDSRVTSSGFLCSVMHSACASQLLLQYVLKTVIW